MNNKNNYRKLFAYMGSKQRHIHELNQYVSQTNKKIYIEPFLGSGILFLNLSKKFDTYFLSEKDPNLYNLWYHFIYNTKIKEFSRWFKEIDFKFKISTYDGFYNLRSYYNNNLYKTNSKEEAYCLLSLISYTINSMMRFSNNGYNNSFGNRSLTDSKLFGIEKSIEYLISMRNKIVLKKDYKEIIHIDDSFVFIDPPLIT